MKGGGGGSRRPNGVRNARNEDRPLARHARGRGITTQLDACFSSRFCALCMSDAGGATGGRQFKRRRAVRLADSTWCGSGALGQAAPLRVWFLRLGSGKCTWEHGLIVVAIPFESAHLLSKSYGLVQGLKDLAHGLWWEGVWKHRHLSGGEGCFVYA
eukprot:516450-Pleurochrysis_carterae.AAC.3